MLDLCQEIARMGRGLSNEHRYRILEALMKGPRTVGEIAAKTGFAQPAVSQHLKVLRSSELVSAERQGKEVYYSLSVAYMTNLLRKLVMNVKRSVDKRK